MGDVAAHKYRNAGSLSIQGVTWCSTNEASTFRFPSCAAVRRFHALTPLRVFPGLPVTNSHNIRSATLTFHIPHAGVLHGLAGYFEAVLYGNIGLSIHPNRKEHISKDMLSWFPLFFPLKVSRSHVPPSCLSPPSTFPGV
jgi:hypothetical protein